jgi:hypothetical protein
MFSAAMQEDKSSEYFENIIKIFRKNFFCTSQISCLAVTQLILGS